MLKMIFLYTSLSLVFNSNAKDAIYCDTSNIRKDGKKEGAWEKNYLLSKKIKSTCEFKNGKRSGHYYNYYKSGFLKISRQYTNNRKDGSECFYGDSVRNESIKRCIRYDNGKKKETIKHPVIDMYE